MKQKKVVETGESSGATKNRGLQTKKNSKKIKKERASNRKQQTIRKFMIRETPTNVHELKKWMESKLKVIVAAYKKENKLMSDRISKNEKELKAMRSKRVGKMCRRRWIFGRKGKSTNKKKACTAEAGGDVSDQADDDEVDAVVQNGVQPDWECYGLAQQIVQDINSL